MCFGGGGDSSSKEMVAMQKQEAAEARQKETERQARIQQGLTNIRQAFHGKPIMKDVAKHGTVAAPGKGTVPGAAATGLPAGYSYVQGPSTTSTVRSNTQNYVGGRDATQPQGPSVRQVTTPGAWKVRGPDGKMYDVGSDVAYTGQEATGESTGGYNDEFYNKFKQKILDYYMPQVAEQLKQAQDETLYRHARAGTMASTAAISNAADLTKQNLNRQGEVQLKADTGAAGLKDKVAKEEAAVQNQLYATENPDVAANATTAAVENINAVKPDTTPLAEIFNVAAIGGANALKGFQNAKYKQGGYGSGSGYGATKII